MKHNFEESTLVTGHIKELLHSFNLPMVPVYTDKTVLHKNRTYIKDNKIVKWDGDDFKFLSDYIYNRQIVNLTKRLEMNSSIYDNYTHEYLGNYLRFLRDYHKVDLMSMYNCFGKKRPSRIFYTQQLNEDVTVDINTDNTNFNYYVVPIKFDQTYTIAIDSEIKYELVSILYSNIFVTNAPQSLISESYMTVSGSKFTDPFLYKTNFSCAEDCWRREKNLVLLLKLPKEIDSSIVILEGDFRSSMNVIDGTLINKIIYDETAFDDNVDFESKVSLLEANLKVSYPFADRLVEYLLNNVISPLDEFKSDVTKVQDRVYKGEIKGYYGNWDHILTNSIHDLILKPDITKGPNHKYGNSILMFNEDGMGVKVVRNSKRFIDIYDDLTNYVDKDVESLLRLL